jgi:carbamoylphosphate synthase large subunit
MPKDSSIKSILIIGSGPIVIGQACEFDYSGSQAARSLREEGIEVILINSNPATIMTDPVMADHIYLLPLEVASIVKILENHKIDAVLPTMGGQTALNLAIKCGDQGMAILMMRSIGNFAGGCNVQFAVSPDNAEDIIAIEINPRVSRSSALASKATGYPIARIAAKLAIGYHLDELKNQITQSTSAYFEPTLDYVIVKIPRWNFDKFKGSDRQLGLQMKSVGEVMAIGRCFQEALQKACQSLEIKRNGLGADGRELRDQNEILHSLEKPSWNRLFHIYDAIKLGIPMKTIQKLTRIDPMVFKSD